jgi:4-diphosphocytidyl-2-C-methyl-D-erythritol kinase
MLKSPAKLNLGLSLTGRRDDGYHFLESLFWPINFCDEMNIQPAKSASVIYQWKEDSPFKKPELLQNEHTLLGKLLEGYFGWKPKQAYAVTIRKRIPIGAGLGGVSSNLGTLLRFLIEQQELSFVEAETLAERAGADVPFFLKPLPSWVTGIGERRFEISLDEQIKKQIFFLLVVFPFEVPTPQIFSKFRELKIPFSQKSQLDLLEPLNTTKLQEMLKICKNDLEQIVCSKFPVVSGVIERLASTAGFYTGLSGSGATCFSAYLSEEERDKAAKEIDSFCRGHLCKIVLAETF